MNLVDRLIIPTMQGRGRMSNASIYAGIQARARASGKRLTPNWKATVRCALQRHSKQSDWYYGPYYFIHHKHNQWELRK